MKCLTIFHVNLFLNCRYEHHFTEVLGGMREWSIEIACPRNWNLFLKGFSKHGLSKLIICWVPHFVFRGWTRCPPELQHQLSYDSLWCSRSGVLKLSWPHIHSQCQHLYVCCDAGAQRKAHLCSAHISYSSSSLQEYVNTEYHFSFVVLCMDKIWVSFEFWGINKYR